MNLDDFLCVIPARGGSVEIPRKNLRIIGGFPLIFYSIQHAIDNQIPLKNIVVSSDDPEILQIASEFNVVAHKRAKEYCKNDSPSEEALMDAFNHHGHDKKHVIMLQPTSPIRMKARLTWCIKEYLDGGYDSLFTVVKLYNLLWFQHEKEGAWFSSYPSGRRLMRQQLDIEDIKYFDCGNIYITNKDTLFSSHSRIGDLPCVYPVKWIEGQQIDSISDLDMANVILNNEIDWTFTKVRKIDKHM